MVVYENQDQQGSDLYALETGIWFLKMSFDALKNRKIWPLNYKTCWVASNFFLVLKDLFIDVAAIGNKIS